MSHQNYHVDQFFLTTLLDFLLHQKKAIHAIISRLHSSLRSCMSPAACTNTTSSPPTAATSFSSSFSFKAKELGDVLRSLGMTYLDEDAKIGVDVLRVFEEEDPRVEEVKEAFDVFDVNKDGFIDAGEVHRVLCALGFAGEVSGVEQCRRMIDVHDHNGDGVLDFDEFLKFMESVVTC